MNERDEVGSANRPAATTNRASTQGPPQLNGRFLTGYDRERARTCPSGADVVRLGGWDRVERRLQSAPESDSRALASPVGDPPPRTGSGGLQPFHFLRDGDRLGRAVVKLQRGDGAVGTGFLVAPDILLTNHHVLPDPSAAAAARALANYEKHPPEGPFGRPATARLDPEALFVTNAELDFTFCAVAGLEFLGAVPLERDSLVAWRAESVHVIQHPRGRPKEVALHDNRVVDADNLVIQYVCDTEPGSSGSPVFDHRWTLVALHHASVSTGVESAEPAAFSDRSLNEGVRLSAIAAWLDTADAEDGADPGAVARLRASFHGPDTPIGFFGGLGRRGLGRSAADAVIELYRGAPGDLDIGFWDLGGPGRPALHRRDDVASVLFEMGVDLWCLANVSPIDAHALLDRINASGRVEHRLLIGHGEPATCFLYRSGVDLCVQPLPTPDDASGGVRIGATTATGGPYRLHLVPVADDDRAAESFLQALAAPAHPPHDWLLIGGFDARALVDRHLDAAQRAGCDLLLAAGPDHVLALMTTGGSGVDRVFVTRNVVPLHDGAGRLAVAHDRPLPDLAHALGSRPPMALRLALAPGQSAVGPVAPAAGPRSTSLGQSDLMARLFAGFWPLIARLIEDSRIPH